MRILAENTQVLVIDFQTSFENVMADTKTVLQKTKTLLTGLKALELPMVVSQQYTKGLGETVDLLKPCIEGAPLVDKVEFSVYQNEEGKQLIKDNQRKNVIICGIESHICVLQTAIDLKEAGYEPIIVWDCLSSRTKESMEIAKLRYQYENICITSVESILFELLVTSKHKAFKEISNLIK